MSVQGNTNMSKVNYILAGGIWPLSFNPEDSDVGENLSVMELVIGTLVRYEGTGRYRPFVAEKWEVLNNGLKYRFYLRDHMTIENGEQISARTYVKNIKGLLKKYSAKTSPPVFKYLVGFDQFLANKADLTGINAISDRIVDFDFTQKVSGLFEFLAMPYFGYYADANFDRSGNWIDKHKIISSGPYKVSAVQDHEIILEKRSEWFSHIQTSPHYISISSRPINEAISQSQNTIIYIRNMIDQRFSDDFIKIRGTPTMLAYAVLSPSAENGVFQDEMLRHEFAEYLRRFFRQNIPEIDGLYPTDSFYFRDSSSLNKIPITDMKVSKRLQDLKLSLAIRPSKADQKFIYGHLMERLMDESGLNIDLKKFDVNAPEWLDWFSSNEFADIRVGSVDIGGEIEDWVIRMMFCSNLGVSFPDPNHSVCHLTGDFEEGKINSAEYAEKFESIIKKEDFVVPLYHYGRIWLFTKNFDLSRLTPTMGIIPFDELGVIP
jgi:hypothetical protein